MARYAIEHDGLAINIILSDSQATANAPASSGADTLLAHRARAPASVIV